MERFLKDLFETTFEELEDKGFDLIRAVEMLCEVCEKPLSKKEKFLRRIQITSREDYQNLLDRASVHDRAEVDIDKSKVTFTQSA
jgi:GTP cyclohydrolase FolE2